MGVLDNLNIIKSCKEDIKQAIADKGVDMTNVAFTEYATKIGEIQAGGGDYLDMRANMSTYYSTAEKVGIYAFAYCSSLQSVNLPNCSSIGSNAFQNCPSLTSINLPMCEYVGSAVFYNCSSLQSVNLPKIVSIGRSMFERCSSLQSVDLPMCESVEDSFEYCLSLTSVNISKCRNIGNYTFSGCINLPSLNIPFCMHIGNNVFASCSSLSVLDLRSTYSCVLSNSNAFSKTPFASGVGSIYVHAAHLAQFQNATNWTYFSKCFVGVGDPTRPLLSFDNGRMYGDTYYLYSNNWKTYLGIKSSSVISIDLPNCSNIFDRTFQYCTSLTSVNLPMCSYVGSFAFSSCSSLTEVNLPMCSYVGGRLFQGLEQNITLYIGTSLSIVCELAGDFTGVFGGGNVPILNGSIFVPMSLVDAYKSAQHWSAYASIIFGI